MCVCGCVFVCAGVFVCIETFVVVYVCVRDRCVDMCLCFVCMFVLLLASL